MLKMLSLTKAIAMRQKQQLNIRTIGFEKIFDHNVHKISDSIQHFRKPCRREDHSRDAIYDCIRLLGHIPVNPSKYENNFFLDSAYCYLGISSHEDTNPPCNSTAETAQAFMRTLCDLAQSELTRSVSKLGQGSAASFMSRPQSGGRTHFLVGPKGSGKTFFINHIFTKNWEFLSERKIVWVRINLNSDRGFDSSITHWIHAQICKLLLRYYDESSMFAVGRNPRMDFRSKIQEWIATQPDDDKGYLRSAFRNLTQTFCEEHSDQEISKELMNDNICKEIFRIARLNGYSFIVIFDGFDRIDHDRRNSVRFKHISEGIGQLISGTAAFGASFLIVCRTGTFNWLSSLPNSEQFRENSFRIGSARLEDILKRRVETIKLWSGDVHLDSFRARAAEIFLLSDRFDSYLSGADGASKIRGLEAALFDNIRSMMQMIQTLFQIFVRLNNAKWYQTVEIMTKSGFNFPPITYGYYQEGDAISTIPLNMRSFDSRFIPIITRPPVPSISVSRPAEYVQSFYRWNSPLHGVRLLQIMEFCFANLGNCRPTVSDVASSLNILFGYDRKITVAMIEDFESFELVELTRTRETFEDSEFDAISITNKGRFILTNIFCDPAYLNLCAMRLLCDVRFISSCGLIYAQQLSIEGDGIRNWLEAKILNVSTMVGIIYSINETEINLYSTIKTEELDNSLCTDLISEGFLDVAFEFISNNFGNVSSYLTRLYNEDLLTDGQFSECVHRGIDRMDGLKQAIDRYSQG
jgi:hypothetical protein